MAPLIGQPCEKERQASHNKSNAGSLTHQTVFDLFYFFRLLIFWVFFSISSFVGFFMICFNIKQQIKRKTKKKKQYKKILPKNITKQKTKKKLNKVPKHTFPMYLLINTQNTRKLVTGGSL
jgi:hypothetical protein